LALASRANVADSAIAARREDVRLLWGDELMPAMLRQ
jgi:hypothetical protein